MIDTGSLLLDFVDVLIVLDPEPKYFWMWIGVQICAQKVQSLVVTGLPGSCSSTFSLPASSVGLGLSKIVGATNKWLRKRLELEKEGQIINPTLHLLHVSVTLRSLDQKNGRQRRKETAENWLRTFIYAAPGLICKLMRGVSGSSRLCSL